MLHWSSPHPPAHVALVQSSPTCRIALVQSSPPCLCCTGPVLTHLPVLHWSSPHPPARVALVQSPPTCPCCTGPVLTHLPVLHWSCACGQIRVNGAGTQGNESSLQKYSFCGVHVLRSEFLALKVLDLELYVDSVPNQVSNTSVSCATSTYAECSECVQPELKCNIIIHVLTYVGMYA